MTFHAFAAPVIVLVAAATPAPADVYPGAVAGVPPGQQPGTDRTYWTHDAYDKVKAWYDKRPSITVTVVRINDKTWISIHPDF